MPRNPDHMAICSPEKSACVAAAFALVEQSAFGSHGPNDNHDKDSEGVGPGCACLPSCTDMDFPHETSVSRLDKANRLRLPQDVMGEE